MSLYSSDWHEKSYSKPYAAGQENHALTGSTSRLSQVSVTFGLSRPYGDPQHTPRLDSRRVSTAILIRKRQRGTSHVAKNISLE
jgi:hypothetical protein